MPKQLRYNYNNTLVGDKFSPIINLEYFAKGELYHVISMDEEDLLLDDGTIMGRLVSWPFLNACFSKYNPKTGELDPLPEPEERAVKAEYVSDHERYLASIGAKSKHMIPDEIREKQELADAELLASSLRSETKGRNPFVPIKRRIIPQPGTYGRVELVSADTERATVSVRLTPKHMRCSRMNSDELREAAHVLNQLAEILEENARNG